MKRRLLLCLTLLAATAAGQFFGGGIVKSVSRKLTKAELLNLNSQGIVVVPAPAGGNLTIPLSVVFGLKFVGARYEASGHMVLFYDDSPPAIRCLPANDEAVLSAQFMRQTTSFTSICTPVIDSDGQPTGALSGSHLYVKWLGGQIAPLSSIASATINTPGGPDWQIDDHLTIDTGNADNDFLVTNAAAGALVAVSPVDTGSGATNGTNVPAFWIYGPTTTARMDPPGLGGCNWSVGDSLIIHGTKTDGAGQVAALRNDGLDCGPAGAWAIFPGQGGAGYTVGTTFSIQAECDAIGIVTAIDGLGGVTAIDFVDHGTACIATLPLEQRFTTVVTGMGDGNLTITDIVLEAGKGTMAAMTVTTPAISTGNESLDLEGTLPNQFGSAFFNDPSNAATFDVIADDTATAGTLTVTTYYTTQKIP